MASKYDLFWTAHLEQIRDGIRLATTRGHAAISLSGLGDEGDRQSWHGTADVRGGEVVRSSMAHVTSLARIVASDGICEQWPDRTIRLAIGSVGDQLTISATTGPSMSFSPNPPAPPVAEHADVWDGDG